MFWNKEQQCYKSGKFILESGMSGTYVDGNSSLTLHRNPRHDGSNYGQTMDTYKSRRYHGKNQELRLGDGVDNLKSAAVHG